MSIVVKNSKASRPYCLKAMRRTVVPSVRKGHKELEFALSVGKVLPKHAVSDAKLSLPHIK